MGMTDHSRLEALETRIAYQDQIIEDLNEAITAQWREIDRLTREMVRLTERVERAEQMPAGAPEDEPPPPHY